MSCFTNYNKSIDENYLEQLKDIIIPTSSQTANIYMMDFTKVIFKKIIPKCEPWTNGAYPEVSLDNKDLLVTYDAEDNTDPGRKRGSCVVKFIDCAMYRVGDPNDHGFYHGGSPGVINNTIYNAINFPSLEFYALYEVRGIDRDAVFSGTDTLHAKANHDSRDINDLTHYLWLMRDGSFECMARGYEFLSLEQT